MLSLNKNNGRPISFWMANLPFWIRMNLCQDILRMVTDVLTSLGMVSSWVLAWLLASRPAAEHRKQTERERERGGKEGRGHKIEFGTLREQNWWTVVVEFFSFFVNGKSGSALNRAYRHSITVIRWPKKQSEVSFWNRKLRENQRTKETSTSTRADHQQAMSMAVHHRDH